MKVLLSKKFMPSDIEYLKNGLSDGITLIEPTEYSEAGVVEKVGEAQAVLGGMLSEPVVAAAKHIKLFQIPWTGVDNIDFSLLQKHNIDCVCNSHSNGAVVAEHALALYFAVAKKIAYHDAQLRTGNWNRVSPEGNDVSPFSRSLSSQKIVLVGYGAVNRGIHRLLAGFSPQISIVNRSGQVTGESVVAEISSFENIANTLKGADAVFIAVPLTSDTRGFFNDSCFKALTQQTIVVNVARGTVIEEQALYNALAENRIYGAGIDTWYNYPKPGESNSTQPSANFPFHELNNLVMSPHRAGYVDSGFPHLDDAIENLNNLHEGKPLINRLSVEHRY
jgi:phosphoglycerate dehydrogenase-like enzyme